ncbi:hypothetical protein [Dietzia cercidiphylli]|uniref:hypothetical protein n=1 Tax=Dietzia cercidiphylli TaxID=498199 RepID=UPI00223B01B3|nr:hypothetical protein [Dietzia cercidiphylli]MCT1515155.1 hypothetical protein [Dietzia cercidiphylli]
MYAWLYRRLPGPTAVRIVLVVVLIAAVFLLLMEVVFPAVEALMPYSHVAVDPVAASLPAP